MFSTMESRERQSAFGALSGNDKAAGNAGVKRGQFCPVRMSELEKMGVGSPPAFKNGSQSSLLPAERTPG